MPLSLNLNLPSVGPCPSNGGSSVVSSGGTVTSVGLQMPVSLFSVANSPITSSGTLDVTFVNQNANTVFAGPTSGGASTPAFRTLVAADIPSLPYGTGTVTSVGLIQPAAGIAISGSPVTSSGNITLALADDLAAIEALAGTGIVRRTGANTWTTGTTVGISEGGTGLTGLGSALEQIRVNAGATALEYFTPAAVGAQGLEEVIIEDNALTASRSINLAGHTLDFTGGGVTRFSDGKASIGSRLSYSWATNPLTTWTDSTPGVTITTDGVDTNFSGGSLDMNNFLRTSFYVGVQNWTATQTIRVNDKSATSRGIVFWINPARSTAPYATGAFMLASTAGYCAYTTNGAVPTGTASTTEYNNNGEQNFQWASGDTLELFMQRRDRKVTVRMVNKTPGVRYGSTSELVVTNIPGVGVGTFNIGFFGGDWDFLNNFSLTYDDQANPKIVLVSDSIGDSAGSDNPGNQLMAYLAKNVRGGVVRMACGFERIEDSILRIADIALANPDIVVVTTALNNILNGTSTGTFDTLYRQFVTDVQAALPSAEIVCASSIPNATDVTGHNTVIADVASDEGARFCDWFIELKNPASNAMDTKFVGDGTHPNEKGHPVLGRKLRETIADLVTAPLPISLKAAASTNTNLAHVLGYNDNGELVLSSESSSNSYLRNKNYVNGVYQAPQSAGVYAKGRFIWAGVGTADVEDFLIIGNGNIANPNFKFSAALATLSAVSVSGGHFTSTGGQTSINSNWLNIVGTAFIKSTSNNPLVLKGNVTNAGSGTAAVVIDTEGANAGSPAAAYRLLSARLNTVEKAYIDKDGKIASGIAGANLGGLLLSGNTSGTVTIQTAAAAGTYTLVLPTDNGTTANQPLVSDASGITSWGPVLGDNTWTATATGILNVDSVSADVGQWLRVGDTVTASVKITLDATTETLPTQARFSLPVASNFASDFQLVGTGKVKDQDTSVDVYADVTNNECYIAFDAPIDTPAMELQIHFTYRIIS